MYGFAFLLILFGIFGAVGGSRKSAFCLALYNLGVLVGICVFVALGVFGFIFSKELRYN
jgi:hypothetical protein